MNGRIEAQATIAAQEWTVDIGGGPVVVTWTDGTYFATELAAMLEARLETVLGVGFTVTVDLVEGGGGRITVAKDSGTFEVVFDSDAQAQLLGVATAGAWDGTPAASFTSAAGMLQAWLPDAPMSNIDPRADGFLTTNAGYLKAPTGDLSVRVGAGHLRHLDVTWSHVRRARVLDGADPALVSWEQFVRETQHGSNAYFPLSVGGYPARVRFYRDATANLIVGDGDGEYRMRAPADLRGVRPVAEFTAYYTVVIPELVKL